MPRYASDTAVPIERSSAEIERVLRRYGATRFMHGWDELQTTLAFTVNDRTVRIAVPMPDPAAPEFRQTPTGRARRGGAVNEAYEQACRQRWRALALVIKAKLEAVDAGISTIESEFLAQTLLPNGQTVGQALAPQIEQAYRDGGIPKLLKIGRE
jgi:hypothetical protein